MYTYDSMLLMLKGYRRIGEHIYRLTEKLQSYIDGYEPKKQKVYTYLCRVGEL